jgi:ABC-type transport system involved in cytochrome c biogenesis ATPase subunit/GNAT superfamily N-acetyltransferase
VEHTERTLRVGEAFGVGLEERRQLLYDDFELRLGEGDVVCVTGDSGSGKSVLLDALRADLGDEAVAMAELPEPGDVPIVDAVGGSFGEALTLLCRVGLNDAYLFLRRYGELSAGQRYRFRLAQMLDSGRRFWLCDEFCSLLDRTTARVVAFSVQKHARRVGATLVAATSHTDLVGDLNPDVRVVKGWGREVMVYYDEPRMDHVCSVAGEVVIEEGDRSDYDRLSHLHYRGGVQRFIQRVYRMTRLGELVGVIVYQFPLVRTQGRREAVGYWPDVDELNRDWALISRVIVHPKYRGIGLGSRLVSETLRLQGRRHVELVAVMALYSPFAERAGMRLVRRTEPSASVLRAVDGLRGLGFDPGRMASRRHNLSVLEGLDDLGQVVKAFRPVRGGFTFRRLTRGESMSTKAEFAEWLGSQDLDSLAKTIQILGVLSQSKAYLYWCRDWVG